MTQDEDDIPGEAEVVLLGGAARSSKADCWDEDAGGSGAGAGAEAFPVSALDRCISRCKWASMRFCSWRLSIGLSCLV